MAEQEAVEIAKKQDKFQKKGQDSSTGSEVAPAQ